MGILARLEGIPPEFDDLTETQSKFTFNTPSFNNSGALFEGGGTFSRCWGHHNYVLYWYRVESCNTTDNLTSSSKMYHKVVGVYTHDIFESWGHTVTANTIAHGNTSMPHAFAYDCYEVSKPPGSNLECEFNWTYVGYQ